MTNRQFQRLIKTYLIKYFQEYCAINGELVRIPVKYLSCGFYFQPSGFNKELFYLWYYVKPLFLPIESVGLGTCDRIRSVKTDYDSWEINEENEQDVMADVLESMLCRGPMLLDPFETFENFPRLIMDRNPGRRDSNTNEMLAYASILLGRAVEAEKYFDWLEMHLPKSIEEFHRDWLVDIQNRTRKVRKAFQSKPSAAIEILHGWRAETAEALKLTKFLAPID